MQHTTLACKSYRSSNSRGEHSNYLGRSYVKSVDGALDDRVTRHDTSAGLREQSPYMSSEVLPTVPLATAGSAALEVWWYTAANLPLPIQQLPLHHSNLLNDRYTARHAEGVLEDQVTKPATSVSRNGQSQL